MSLIFTPHTITIQPAIQNVGVNRTANAITYGTAYTVMGQICNISSRADWPNFGLQTEVNARMLLNISDASTINVSDQVSCQGTTYKVTAQPKISQHGLITDHAMIMLEVSA